MTMTDIPPTTIETGWLGRAWIRHLEAEEAIAVSRRTRHEYMCSSGLADVLEPFATLEGPWAKFGDRIVHFDGLGADAAAVLLTTLPDEALEQDYSTLAPSARKMLTAVVQGDGAITCGGEVFTPSLPSGGMRIRILTVEEPELLDQEPDLVAGELPAWLEELPAEAYSRYVKDRQHCLDHGVTRQAWMLVSTRHDLDDAHMPPSSAIVTDEAGTHKGVRFQW